MRHEYYGLYDGHKSKCLHRFRLRIDDCDQLVHASKTTIREFIRDYAPKARGACEVFYIRPLNKDSRPAMNKACAEIAFHHTRKGCIKAYALNLENAAGRRWEYYFRCLEL